MIVITGATGNIGSQVLSRLLAGEEKIRVIVRDPAKLPQQIRDQVEVFQGSHGDRAVVERAFEGADGVFWLVAGDMAAASANTAYVDFARPALDAFRSISGKHVVSVSALGRGWPHEAGHVTATLQMDEMIAATGVHYRALACPSLMENLLRQVQPIRQHGVFYWPIAAERQEPSCATRDVAAAAAELLLDRAWSGFEDHPILGPDDISFGEMASIMSEVLGRPIRFQEIAMEDMRAQTLARGASAGMAQAMVDMLTAKSQGMDHMVQRTPETASPTSFRTWCEEVLKPNLLPASA